MSKEPLNLSIEKNLKQRAKKIARDKGISISRFFEELVAKQEDPQEYKPNEGSAAYRIYHALPESRKVDHVDYKKIKEDALKEKYGH
ncbi:MAG: DUF6364 family protein [Balneolaceae bacterium]